MENFKSPMLESIDWSLHNFTWNHLEANILFEHMVQIVKWSLQNYGLKRAILDIETYN
jgi:hypothetical protein